MTMFARKIGTVPTEGFKWYIVLLEGPFVNELREQIDKHFINLGKAAGPDVLVVRGYDPIAFRESVVAEALLGPDHEWKEKEVEAECPALMVTDALEKNVNEKNGLDKASVMIFPLREMYKKDKDISIFFEKLLAALHSDEASDAIKKLDKCTIEKYWDWITEYSEMKPSFFGFKADLGKIFGDLLQKAR